MLTSATQVEVRSAGTEGRSMREDKRRLSAGVLAASWRYPLSAEQFDAAAAAAEM